MAPLLELLPAGRRDAVESTVIVSITVPAAKQVRTAPFITFRRPRDHRRYRRCRWWGADEAEWGS
jgi:hypothetical protein